MAIPDKDKTILRELGREIAEIAALPVQDEKRDLWTRLNRLERVRPLVWINEIPWHELSPGLEVRSEDGFCRGIEGGLRRLLYQWRHFPGDMVVDGVFYSGYVFGDTGYGVQENSVRPDFQGHGSRDFIPVIRTAKDVERIQMPEVTADWDATERNYEACCDIFDGVLPVEKRGITHLWCAPWDVLITWWGIEELYMDMTDDPAKVHAGMSRMMDALLHRLDQYESMGLLSVGNGNHRVGSGGLGITDQLPQPDYDGEHCRTKDLWGTSTGQIFSEVSPDMHWEFCLQYEMRWLERFGLNCYGCCEPLHKKMGILSTVPNLRRVSMSPFINLAQAVEAVAANYVFSSKPNPSSLAQEAWNPEQVRRELREVLEATRGCVVELILKDITTVRNEPRRLWEWETVAMEVAEEFA